MVSLSDLMVVFEEMATKFHTENVSSFTLDQTVVLHQMIGIMITFLILRALISGLLSIPRCLFCRRNTVFKKVSETVGGLKTHLHNLLKPSPKEHHNGE